MIELATFEPNTQIEPNNARGGLNVHLDQGGMRISPTWHLGGFLIRFAHLPAGKSLALDPSEPGTYVKVVIGEIATRKSFPAVGEVRSTQTKENVSTASGAILCIISETAEAADKITDMSSLAMSGPYSELLSWQSFDEKFGAFTDIFKNLEAHMVPGFHLLDTEGAEIAYVHFWTTGKGVDVSTHDHGNAPSELSPAFAETHLVLRNGTGSGAMYECAAPGAAERTRLIIGAGEEHGPFFRFDPETGKPVMRENGAVDYPWHGWQGGEDGEPGEAYDLVAAFEISPDYTQALP